jgi:hypothetical protein
VPTARPLIRNLTVLAIVALLALAGSSAALAIPKFDTRTGVRLSATAGQGTEILVVSGVRTPYNGRPAGVPKEARTIQVRLPAGTSLLSRAPRCTALRDQKWRLTADCEVGLGFVETFVRPIDEQGNFTECPPDDPRCPFWCNSSRQTVYHVVHHPDRGHWLYLNTPWDPTTQTCPFRGTDIMLAKIGRNGRTITVDLANQSHLFIVLRIKSRRLFRTPMRCNPAKGWKSRVTVRYVDGTSDFKTFRHKCRPRR